MLRKNSKYVLRGIKKPDWAAAMRFRHENPEYYFADVPKPEVGTTYHFNEKGQIMMWTPKGMSHVIFSTFESNMIKQVLEIVEDLYRRHPPANNPKWAREFLSQYAVLCYAYFVADREVWPQHIYGVLGLLKKEITIDIIEETLRKIHYHKTKRGTFRHNKLKKLSPDILERYRVKAANQYILECDLEKTDFGELITYQRDGMNKEDKE